MFPEGALASLPHLLQKVVGGVRWETIDEKAPQILMITFVNLPLETKKKIPSAESSYLFSK